jgi:hypothetical protein
MLWGVLQLDQCKSTGAKAARGTLMKLTHGVFVSITYLIENVFYSKLSKKRKAIKKAKLKTLLVKA